MESWNIYRSKIGQELKAKIGASINFPKLLLPQQTEAARAQLCLGVLCTRKECLCHHHSSPHALVLTGIMFHVASIERDTVETCLLYTYVIRPFKKIILNNKVRLIQCSKYLKNATGGKNFTYVTSYKLAVNTGAEMLGLHTTRYYTKCMTDIENGKCAFCSRFPICNI